MMIEYEKGFISGLLTDFKKSLIHLEKIKPKYFSDSKLANIYSEIIKLHQKGIEPDLTSLGDKVEDPALLMELGSHVIFAEKLGYYSQMLFEGYCKRFIAEKANRVLYHTHEKETPLSELIELDNEKPEHFIDDSLKSPKDLVEITAKKFDLILSGKEKKLKTGSCFIDEKTDGLEEGSLNIVAARPGNGKTSFVIDLLHNFTGKAIFYSLEMNEWEIGKKFISRDSGIDVSALSTKHCLQVRQKDILKSSAKFADKKLWIDCRPGKTPTDILTQCKYLKQSKGLDLIVIDYLQIMKLGDKSESKVVEIGKISQSLKDLAKQVDVPVIALSQLGRAVDSRTDKRPVLSDLRWAGEIEENAHKIIFLHIPNKYNDKEDPHKTEVILAKNRTGEADLIKDLFVERSTSLHRFYTGNDEKLNENRIFQNG